MITSIFIFCSILLPVFITMFGGDVTRAIKTRKENKNLAIEPSGPKLSIVSRTLLKEYKELPVEHQFGDIKPMLHALDVKHEVVGKDNLGHLSRHNGWDGYYFAWLCDCTTYAECQFSDYWDLHNKIEAIKEQLKETVRVLAIAEVQGDLDALSSFTQHLDNERAALVESTKTVQDALSNNT